MIEAVISPTRVSGSSHSAVSRVLATDCEGTDAPLRALVDSDLAGRFRHWIGVSGRRHLFSVFSICAGSDGCPRYEDAIVLAVARATDGTRRIVWAGETGLLPDLFFDGDLLACVIAGGANEIHMHLLAKDRTARANVLKDIVG